MICSKIVNFDRTETGLTSKWGRILPAVQWCYKTSLTAPHDDIRRRLKICYTTGRHPGCHDTAYIARQPSLKKGLKTPHFLLFCISPFCTICKYFGQFLSNIKFLYSFQQPTEWTVGKCSQLYLRMLQRLRNEQKTIRTFFNVNI